MRIKCPQVVQPACGSDGKTYGNECELEAEACQKGTDITVKHDGNNVLAHKTSQICFQPLFELTYDYFFMHLNTLHWML